MSAGNRNACYCLRLFAAASVISTSHFFACACVFKENQNNARSVTEILCACGGQYSSGDFTKISSVTISYQGHFQKERLLVMAEDQVKVEKHTQNFVVTIHELRGSEPLAHLGIELNTTALKRLYHIECSVIGFNGTVQEMQLTLNLTPSSPVLPTKVLLTTLPSNSFKDVKPVIFLSSTSLHDADDSSPVISDNESYIGTTSYQRLVALIAVFAAFFIISIISVTTIIVRRRFRKDPIKMQCSGEKGCISFLEILHQPASDDRTLNQARQFPDLDDKPLLPCQVTPYAVTRLDGNQEDNSFPLLPRLESENTGRNNSSAQERPLASKCEVANDVIRTVRVARSDMSRVCQVCHNESVQDIGDFRFLPNGAHTSKDMRTIHSAASSREFMISHHCFCIPNGEKQAETSTVQNGPRFSGTALISARPDVFQSVGCSIKTDPSDDIKTSTSAECNSLSSCSDNESLSAKDWQGTPTYSRHQQIVRDIKTDYETACKRPISDNEKTDYEIACRHSTCYIAETYKTDCERPVSEAVRTDLETVSARHESDAVRTDLENVGARHKSDSVQTDIETACNRSASGTTWTSAPLHCKQELVPECFLNDFDPVINTVRTGPRAPDLYRNECHLSEQKFTAIAHQQNLEQNLRTTKLESTPFRQRSSSSDQAVKDCESQNKSKDNESQHRSKEFELQNRSTESTSDSMSTERRLQNRSKECGSQHWSKEYKLQNRIQDCGSQNRSKECRSQSRSKECGSKNMTVNCTYDGRFLYPKIDVSMYFVNVPHFSFPSLNNHTTEPKTFVD